MSFDKSSRYQTLSTTNLVSLHRVASCPMAENAFKKQCMREPPSCWIPSSAAAVVLPTSMLVGASPPVAAFAAFAPTAPVAPPLSPASAETMRRLEAAQARSLKYRDPRFPGAGMLRDEGGVVGLMTRAVAEGRDSWL